MEQKAVELAEAHAARVEKRLHGGLEMVAQEKRQVRTQHHAESVMPDVPAHDVLGVAPEMIARGDDPPAPARCLSHALGVAQNDASGTVAEQRRRHAHSHARIVDPKAEAAKIDGEEQHMRRRHGLSVATRSREPGNAAATTEPEDRQTLDRRRQLEPVHQLRIKAWYGKPTAPR